MKVSYSWLQTYFDAPLPPIEKVAEAFTFHSFEIEEVVGDILDLKVLPNRAQDCLSHRGVALDLSAILNMPIRSDVLREPIPSWPSHQVPIVVEAPGCDRYMAAVVRGVTVKESPQWLKDALQSVGQRSINNIVDATNYVMLNCGQPLHAFDLSKIDTGVVVRQAVESESIQILGGTTVSLQPSVLIIAEKGGQALGIAGIKGGTKAEIDAKTTDILIESAHFNATQIRKSAQFLKLWTDASLRFQNNLSPELCAYGMRDVIALIQSIAGGSLEGVTDSWGGPAKPFKVGVSVHEVTEVLGAPYSKAEIQEVFERLCLPYECITVPREKIVALARQSIGAPYKLGASVRNDAPQAFDCSSFSAWLCAQVGITAPRVSVDQFLWGMPIEKGELKPGDLILANTKKGHVWYESDVFLPGVSVPEGVDHVGVYVGDGEVIHAAGDPHHRVIIEKLDESDRFLNTVGYRRPYGIDEERLVVTVPFERTDLKMKEDLIEEVGRILGYDRVQAQELTSPTPVLYTDKRKRIEALRSLLVNEGFNEVSTYAMTDVGDVELMKPLADDKRFLRSTLAHEHAKSILLNTPNMPLIGAEDVRLFEVGHIWPNGKETFVVGITYSSPGKNANQKRDAAFTEVRKKISDLLQKEIPQGMVCGNTIEFNVHELVEEGPSIASMPEVEKLGAYRPFSIYPFVLRDIALWVPEDVGPEEITLHIQKKGTDLLQRIDLFDTFSKDGKVSYAFHLVFQSIERTLSDVEVSKIMESITESVLSKGWSVR